MSDPQRPGMPRRPHSRADQPAQREYALMKQATPRFNGNVVSAATGLKGLALGQFLDHLKSKFYNEAELHEFVLGRDDDALKLWIQCAYVSVCEEAVVP